MWVSSQGRGADAGPQTRNPPYWSPSPLHLLFCTLQAFLFRPADACSISQPKHMASAGLSPGENRFSRLSSSEGGWHDLRFLHRGIPEPLMVTDLKPAPHAHFLWHWQWPRHQKKPRPTSLPLCDSIRNTLDLLSGFPFSVLNLTTFLNSTKQKRKGRICPMVFPFCFHSCSLLTLQNSSFSSFSTNKTKPLTSFCTLPGFYRINFTPI